jgi:hypothetical protein
MSRAESVHSILFHSKSVFTSVSLFPQVQSQPPVTKHYSSFPLLCPFPPDSLLERFSKFIQITKKRLHFALLALSNIKILTRSQSTSHD